MLSILWVRVLNSNQTQTECERVQSLDLVAEEENHLTKYTGLGLSIFAFVVITTSVVIFGCFRKKYSRTTHRNFPLLLAFSFGSFCYTILVPFRDYYGQSEFPCDLYAIMACFSSFFLLIPQGCRALSLYHRLMFSRTMLDLTFESMMKGEVNALSKSVTSREKLQSMVVGVLNQEENKPSFERTKQLLNRTFICVSELYWGPTRLFAPLMYFLTSWRKPKAVPESLQLRYFLASQQYSIFFCGALFVLYIAAYISFYTIVFAPLAGCTGCGIAALYYLQLPVVGICCVIYVASMIALYPFPDALGVKKELIRLGIFVLLIYGVVVPVLNGITNKPEERGEWNWSFGSHLAFLATVVYCLPYQIYVASKNNRKVTSAITLDDILKDDEGIKAFALHLAAEFSIENLYFYKAVEAWKMACEQSGTITMQSQAAEIMNLYIKEQAPLQINISWSARIEVEEKVKSAAIDEKTFDRAINEVFSLMESDSFSRFQSSKYFLTFQNRVQEFNKNASFL